MNTDKNSGIQTHAAAGGAAATASEKEYPEQELTGAILQAAFAVHHSLGAGFLERVYSHALAVELDSHQLKFVQNGRLQVKYRDVIVGDYMADTIVENRFDP
jgi:hypothetical protein